MMKHANYRTNENKRYKGQDDRYAPTKLFQEIGVHSTLKDDGSISWPMDKYHPYELAAISSIKVYENDEQPLNSVDSNNIVLESIKELIKIQGSGKPIKPRELLSTVEKKAKELFQRPKKKRYLVTSLSIDKKLDTVLDINGVQIKSTTRKEFPFPDRLRNHPGFLASHVKSSDYEVISALTEEVTIHQAYDRSMRTINYLRGLWSFISSFSSFQIGWSIKPERTWIGKIQCSPIQTLHELDGSNLDEGYFYEPDYTEDIKLFKSKKWNIIETERLKIMELIDKLPFKVEIIELFSRYAIALDQSNLNVCLLMLWGILEKFTDTVGKAYDETIERTIWPYEEREISKQLLNHVRTQRNSFVHAGTGAPERDRECYTIKSFIDQHFDFLIRNVYMVGSLAEYGEFLSLPHSTDRLSKMCEKYSRALEIQKQMAEAADDQTFSTGVSITHSDTPAAP
ncbi:MAG: hypothetical protein O2955_17980 [Planctomycetota bacterium]|nr:hypothetical protein [Planctomycetota bacterium]MDA1214402.1 hypothetical protein [Planctomycetota bacterium]